MASPKHDYYDSGIELYNQKKYKEAIKQFQEAIQLDPAYTDAYLYWGNALYAQKKYVEAIAQYQKTIEIDPGYKYAYFNWGLALNAGKKYEEAITKYQKAIEIDSDYSIAYYNWGLALNAEKKYGEAVDKFRKAIQLDPAYTAAYNDWGNALYAQKKYEEAIAQYQKAVGIDPGFKHAYLNWGLSLHGEKKYEEAITKYQKAIEIDSGYSNAYFYWGDVLHDLKKYDKAIEQYQKAVELDPGYTIAYYNWGLALHDEKKYGEAVEKFRKAIQLDPAYTVAYNDWGNALYAQKKYEEAIVQYQKAVEIDPDFKHAYFNWGLSLHGEKKYEEAIAQYQKAIEIDPGYPNPYYNWGNLLSDQKKYEQALEKYEKANEVNKDYVFAKHNIAHYMHKLGRYGASRRKWLEVLEDYEGLFKSNGNDVIRLTPDLYYYAGTIYLESFGNIDEAEKKFREAISLEGDNLFFIFALNELFAEKDKRQIKPDLTHYSERLANLDKAEHLEKAASFDVENYFPLANLYFMEERYKEAQDAISKYLTAVDERDERVFNLQGRIYTAQEKFIQAIEIFKKAIRLDPYDINLQVNLANVYLKNKNYNSAEIAYNEIIQKDVNNVDAYIGLGEIYLINASEGEEDFPLDKAENYFLKALELGTGTEEKGSKRLDLYKPKGDQERKYKNLTCSDLQYSLGYILVKRYVKSRNKFDYTYLYKALKCFEKSLGNNPDNLKAKVAKEKVKLHVKENKNSVINEKVGTYLITSFAVVLFVLAQISFFSVPLDNNNPVLLSDEGISYLGEIFSLSQDNLDEMQYLKQIAFDDKETLMEALNQVIPPEELESQNLLLSKSAFYTEIETKKAAITEGYYVLISFGSLIFMIAGLFLPKLLKIKVGNIELEKNSPTEMNFVSLLQIKK